MKYLFTFLLFTSSLFAMEKIIVVQDPEKKVFAHRRKDVFYRDFLENAVRHHYHDLSDSILTIIKDKKGTRGLGRILNKGFFAAVEANNIRFLKRAMQLKPSKTTRSRALYVAAKNGSEEIVQLMLENGADINFQSKKNGTTALAMAIKHDREAVVTLLLTRKAKPNGPAPHSFPDLLSWVVMLKHGLKYSRILLEHGANPNGLQESNQLKPLMFATVHNQPHLVELLLSFGADVNVQMPESKHTALIKATKKGHVEVVEILLSGTVDPSIQKAIMQCFMPVTHDWDNNYIKRLPREVANEVAQMRFGCADHLLTDRYGNTALQIAQDLEARATEEKKKKYARIIELLESQHAKQECKEIKQLEG